MKSEIVAKILASDLRLRNLRLRPAAASGRLFDGDFVGRDGLPGYVHVWQEGADIAYTVYWAGGFFSCSGYLTDPARVLGN